MAIKYTYEVTVDFETALFERSTLTMQVQDMADVLRLQDKTLQGHHNYRFVSYRGPIAAVKAENVFAAIANERFEQNRVATGRVKR